MGKRFLFVINMLSLLVVLIAIIKLYPALPERFPTHFGLNGQPDNWGTKSSLWILYVVQLGLNFILLGLTIAMPWFRRHPEWSSIGKRILNLPPKQQERYWQAAGELLMLLSLGVNLTFAVITRATIRVALKQQPSLGWTPMLMVALTLIVTWLWAIELIRFSRLANT